MRIRISLDDELVRQLDELVGPRGRSRFIAESIREKLEREWRWEKIRSAYGSISDHGHQWGEDPAKWVQNQRADPGRVG